MRYDFWIAWRYMLSRRYGSFGGLIMAVSILGIGIAVFSLVIIMSVMNGFNDELTKRLLGFDPHIVISAEADDAGAFDIGRIRAKIPGDAIEILSPYSEGEVIAQSDTTGEPLAQGARLRGISLGDDGLLSKLGAEMPPAHRGGRRAAVVGSEIVMMLAVYPGFGDMLKITAPLAEVGPTGELAPNSSELEVVGAFRTGIYNWDSKYILTDVASADDVLGLQARRGYLLWLSDPDDMDSWKESVAEILPDGWKVENWKERNSRLFSALRLERFAMAAVLAMALLISSFGILVIVQMIVAHRRKDIAIMRSLGMSAGDIRNIFLVNAALIGGAGSLFGTVLGIAVCAAMKMHPVALPASYYLDHLPVVLGPLSTVVFLFTGIAVALLAAIYPVGRASSMNVLEVLRYE